MQNESTHGTLNIAANKYIPHFNEVSHITNLFDDNDIKWMTEFMFRHTKNWRLGGAGNIFYSGNLDKVVKKFYKQISKHVNLDIVTNVRGNYFLTPHQYGFHTDMPERTDKTYKTGDVAFKSILIPLFKKPEECRCHIFFFKERLISYGTTLDKGPTKSHSFYDSYSSYQDIDFIYDVKGQRRDYQHSNFNQDIYDDYNMSATSLIERYEGFNIEKVLNWEPGSMIVFDTSQLHCSNRGLKGMKSFKIKAGLRISFFTNDENQRKTVDWSKVSA